ncbi:MAG: hypothetical protein CL917_09835 [Deltaproteobacteria bacterium]|nr:hypothetical protein [Deltaproteobacteria bacterium]
MIWLKLLCVAAGGGTGACLRHGLIYLFSDVAGWPVYIAVMTVNLLGCFLIGFVFMYIEQKYRYDGAMRVRELPYRNWWPDKDPTASAVDQFKMDQNAELVAAFGITGLLGAMTTFSLFSLLSFQSIQSGAPLEAVINTVGSVLIGLVAVALGMSLASYRATTSAD